MENPPGQNRISGIEKAKKRIYRQAALTVLTVLLTVLILFAMTSAWYTNVVQTSGLTFEAESWGFEGNITVSDRAIPAAPGDSGIIDLTVENDSDSVSAISVNVSKSTMPEEMQQRLFFYVDTRMIRNEEVVDRVYLNRYEGYTYNVFNKSQLTLTAESGNAPVIKWEWVYDVLGYYVIGQPETVSVTAEETGNENEATDTVQKMIVKEYLRPIVYDYDEATTQLRTEGESIAVELATVDGVKTPEQFLAELFQTDGYAGDTVEQAFDNYYKVDVDANGYGVYAYLCNYSEIETATQYDTRLGELARRKASGEVLTEAEEAELCYTASLQLSAQQEENTVISLSTVGALQDAVYLEMADVIQLTGNVVAAEGTSLQIPAGRRVTVDLNGYTLTSKDGAAITAQPGSSLTLINGTLQQDPAVTDSTTYGIRATGAEVVMSQVTVDGFRHGIYVGDNAADNQLDSRIHIMDSTISGDICAAFISGNGLVSEQKSLLIIERSTLSSPNIVVSGNGDSSGNGRWGTDIQIIDSKILGTETADSDQKSVGIYQPQKNSTLTIRDSLVDGGTGIALKGGTAIIENATIIGHGTYTAPAENGSGSTDTGDAVYIETNYHYEIQLRISGERTSLEHLQTADGQTQGSLSLRVFREDSPYVLVEIKGGTFDEAQPEAYLADGCTQTAFEEESQTRYRVVGPVQAGETAENESGETAEGAEG